MTYETYRQNAAGQEKLVTTSIEVNHIDSDGYVDLDVAVVTEIEDGDTTVEGAVVGEALKLTDEETEEAEDQARDDAEKAARAYACDGPDDEDWPDEPYSERYPMNYAGLRPELDSRY